MSTKPSTSPYKDAIIIAIGVLVLSLCTATGNAIVMLVMSILGLAVIAMVERPRLRRSAFLVMLVAAAAGAALGFALGWL